MIMAEKLATAIDKKQEMELWGKPITAVNVFRPTKIGIEEFMNQLPEGMLSTCILDNNIWLRSVAANPLADIELIISTILDILD